MISGSFPYDKRSILKIFSEEQIFELAGLTVVEGLCLNPLRNDSTPGCRFQRRDPDGFEQLYFCDPSGFFGKACITCVDAVQQVHGFKNHVETLEYIIENCKKDVVIPKIAPIRNRVLDIKFKYRKWLKSDYLVRQGFSENYLYKEGFYMVTKYWIDFGQGPTINPIGNPSLSLCIACVFKSGRVKLYFPKRTKKRFYTNCTKEDIWGEYFVGDTLFITKSGKDYLTLKYICNLDVIGVQNENIMIPNIVGYDRVIILFDNDQTGILNSLKFKEEHKYDIATIDLPYGDPFEVLEAKGIEFTHNYFNNYVR